MNSLKIYETALKDLGLKETPGPKSSPRIRVAISLAASWLNQDDSLTPWCGCIRGIWGIESNTGMPKEYYRAASWLKWGKAVELVDAVKGDTVIFKRSGGHHVALFTGSKDNAYLSVLGGNQSNAVTIARMRISDVVGVRRA